jgi:hypothetical protein
VSAGLAWLVVLAATTLTWRTADLADLPLSRRYWEDLTVAASRLDPAPGPVEEIGSYEGLERRKALQNWLVRESAEASVRPWQPWRGMPLRPYLRRVELRNRPTEDGGRAWVLAALFRLRGQVLPFAGLWLGALAALPVFLAVSTELAASGRPTAGALLVLLCAFSPFFVESLSLPYSGIGFFVLALLALSGLAAYATGPEVSVRGVLLRAAGYTVFLALASSLRGSATALLPGYALALALAGYRTPARARAAAAAVAVLVLGLLVLRGDSRHDKWVTLWEGLGDFDRTHGHAWNDDAVRAIAVREGIDLPTRSPLFERGAEIEAVMKPHVLRAIQGDPAWYAGILVKRALATVSLFKLWPWAPLGGASMRAATTPNEGVMDDYWSMTTTADFLGLGPWRLELPMPLLLAPPLVLLGLVATRRLPPAPAAQVGLVGLAALGVPVAVTTCSGLETEAFVLVHLLAASLLADHVLRRQERPATGPGVQVTTNG